MGHPPNRRARQRFVRRALIRLWLNRRLAAVIDRTSGQPLGIGHGSLGVERIPSGALNSKTGAGIGSERMAQRADRTDDLETSEVDPSRSETSPGSRVFRPERRRIERLPRCTGRSRLLG